MLGNILGGIASGVLGLIGAERANSANRSMANAQMAFQADQNDEARNFNQNEATRAMEWSDLQRRHQEAFQSASTNRAFDFQRETLSSAMDYNTRMSNTSYQRGMADMRAAGLNPILAFGQGGATAPSVGSPSGPSASGAMGSSSMATSPTASGSSAQMGNSIGAAISTAAQGARLVTELEQLAANVDQTKAHTALIGEQQHQVRASTALGTAQAITEGVRPDLIRATTRTEEGRPAALGAQTARDSASARNLDAQTQTEREMPELRRAQAGATIQQGNLARGQAANTQYGPPGPISSTVGGISATVDNIWRSIRQALQ